MSLSQDDLRLLRWVGGISAVTGDDNCVPTLRRLVKKQDTPGALTEQHARIFTLLTTNEECKDILFHFLNLIRVRSGKSPLDETAEPTVLDNFRKAIKVLQHFNNQADALVQASNLFAFLQGESPTVAEDAFDKLLSQDPSTALSLYRTRGTLPADKLSLVRAAAAGNKIAILRLADTSVVPDVVPANLELLQQREAELNAREEAFRKKIQTISARLGLPPGEALEQLESHDAERETDQSPRPEENPSANPQVIPDTAPETPSASGSFTHSIGAPSEAPSEAPSTETSATHANEGGLTDEREPKRAQFFLNSSSPTEMAEDDSDSEAE